MRETEKIWMNGELVDWADAKVHVGVHGLHYGTGVFEGIRCYETPKGPSVFRFRFRVSSASSPIRRCSRTALSGSAPARRVTWLPSARSTSFAWRARNHSIS